MANTLVYLQVKKLFTENESVIKKCKNFGKVTANTIELAKFLTKSEFDGLISTPKHTKNTFNLMHLVKSKI